MSPFPPGHEICHDRFPSVHTDAEGNQRGQGLPDQGPPEGRARRQDKEERGQHQVQDPLLAIPLHTGRVRQGEGREAEAVAAAGSAGQGSQVDLTTCAEML